MMINKNYIKKVLFLAFCVALFCLHDSYAQENQLVRQIDEKVTSLMKEGDIPGLSLVITTGDKSIIKSYGYANLESQELITPRTLFELGSLSKAFTAIAIIDLDNKGEIDLSKPVSNYLPWFYATYNGQKVDITLRQLLHHTGGIPWGTISMIPQSNEDDALEQTVRKLIGQELDNLPGEEYEYATIGYDVLALIIQKVKKQPFETYLQEEIINNLGMSNTSIGVPKDNSLMSSGYKIGFSSPREYNAPKFKGNNAAGYVISNAEDITKWINLHLGKTNSSQLAKASRIGHLRDKTVAPHGVFSYGGGWHVSLKGDGELFHDGLNPNFSSYISIRPDQRLGIAILTNCNSETTQLIGSQVSRIMTNDLDEKNDVHPGDGNDTMYSSISIVLIIFSLVVFAFLVFVITNIIKGRRRFNRINLSTIIKLFKPIVFISPFVYGIYMLPETLLGFTWESVLVWSPISLEVLMQLIPIVILFTYFVYIVSVIFPESNIYWKKLPGIVFLSVLAGLSNVIVIIMVTSMINSEIEWQYLAFYYGLIGGLYLFGRKFVQVSLIKLTRKLVYNLRVDLIEKIFSTSFQSFEKIERGRVYTALNDDVSTIGSSTNLFVSLVTSIITAIGAFLYLASIAFWATILTICLILFISVVYYFTVQRTNIYYEEARTTRNVFMNLIADMINGYKELSLHRNKKLEYKNDIADIADEYREKTTTAEVRFVNAFLVGESLLLVLMGIVSIGLTKIFPNIQFHTVLSFIIVLLYLIGPINSILGSVPSLVGLRIAWNRVSQFISEIPVNLKLIDSKNVEVRQVDRIEARNVSFEFKNEEEETGFSVGPINLEVNKGEILFLIGGNGSGKTTLAKLLTGLYKPDGGEFLINGEKMKNFELSEYFSVVFNPPQLFSKLYNITVKDNEEVKKYLETLDLQDKVEITDSTYNTIQLSSGQVKRLALLQCYLEDSPIYLFDEWAADQDPDYRKFFYEHLLQEMKKDGKIVIVITHDDNYFHVADRVVKMDNGELKEYSENKAFMA
ncbi:cyclic peptide export ABC transporter [Aquimarina sp. AU474]|uniref:cyclic peptide export ABC transporter n=1 Tax=Aquimarina sp. AU474 TaxID=2108529 RepID=UPI000D68FB4C|nr:cyclic peptide export ABC transporter [Aquimarina sp. AU474]